MSSYSGITGKRILITGANSGLGLAMAKALLTAGAKVLLTGRDKTKIDQAASSVISSSGQCVGMLIDVRDEQSIAKGVAKMEQCWGGIDILINNAGIGMRSVNPRFMTDPAPFWEVSSTDFRELMNTNLTGYFLVAKAVVPYFLKAGKGRIINIDASEATKKRKGFIPYGPSRAGTESLSHIMAQDLAGYGVTVNLPQPGGLTETGMVPGEFRAESGVQHLQPEVMVEPVLFLCADESEGLTDEQIVDMDFKQRKTNGLLQHQTPAVEELLKKVDFLREIDQLKNVVRQNYNADGLRRENTAEHSWQIALMPMLFADLSNQPVDLLKVTQMLLIHDIVEIDAGDTYLYDETGYTDKREREQKAAERIFGLLPAELGRVFNELWLEFEDGQSNEAKFAVALDNLMPELNNYFSGGKSCHEHGLTFQMVYNKKRIIAEGSESLWKLMQVILEKAKDEKLLPD